MVGPAHREGLRERPCDVPATAANPRCRPRGSDRGNGANSGPARETPGEDEEGDFMSAAVTEQGSTTGQDQQGDQDGTGLRPGAFGNATALSCRECGHLVALGPHYACPECFGPLEVAYD